MVFLGYILTLCKELFAICLERSKKSTILILNWGQGLATYPIFIHIYRVIRNFYFKHNNPQEISTEILEKREKNPLILNTKDNGAFHYYNCCVKPSIQVRNLPVLRKKK